MLQLAARVCADQQETCQMSERGGGAQVERVTGHTCLDGCEQTAPTSGLRDVDAFLCWDVEGHHPTLLDALGAAVQQPSAAAETSAMLSLHVCGAAAIAGVCSASYAVF